MNWQRCGINHLFIGKVEALYKREITFVIHILFICRYCRGRKKLRGQSEGDVDALNGVEYTSTLFSSNVFSFCRTDTHIQAYIHIYKHTKTNTPAHPDHTFQYSPL